MKLIGTGWTVLALAACGNAFSADYSAEAQPTVPNVEKPIRCPQCGAWAISEASEVMGPHNQRIREIDGPVGTYLYVGEDTITIPFCGWFQYRVTSSSIEREGNASTYHYTMALERKAEGDSLLCKGSSWMLDMRIGNGAVDLASQGGFKLSSDAAPNRYFQAWNMDRSDPSQSDGTPGIGQVAAFKVAEATTALSQAAIHFHRSYEYAGAEPFNVARFTWKVKRYCENYYTDIPYNPSIGNLMLRCEYLVLAAKYEEFLTFTCKAKSSVQRCRLPTETLTQRRKD